MSGSRKSLRQIAATWHCSYHSKYKSIFSIYYISQCSSYGTAMSLLESTRLPDIGEKSFGINYGPEILMIEPGVEIIKNWASVHAGRVVVLLVAFLRAESLQLCTMGFSHSQLISEGN